MDINNLYNREYFNAAPVTQGLRTADEWPALAYAYGIYNVPILFTVEEQIQYIKNNKQRNPKIVVEIGSGRGSISACLWHMGCEVYSSEINNWASHWHKASLRRFFKEVASEKWNIHIGSLDTFKIPTIVDTVILCESIEHIEQNEFKEWFEKNQFIFKKNNMQMIITNQKHYWPLGGPGDTLEHVALINDEYYDNLEQISQKVLLRDNSHLVIEF